MALKLMQTGRDEHEIEHEESTEDACRYGTVSNKTFLF